MKDKTAWEKAAEAQGTTASERALTRLARKAFLSLWSYPNVYSDDGRSTGKELVDLLVVFGNDVLLFSDKHCAFQADIDVKVAWPRWYRRAIEKSARQLAGAESFLEAVECFAGFLNVRGVRLEIDFEVPVGATDTVKDADFLAALAQQVDLNYLSLGQRQVDAAALRATAAGTVGTIRAIHPTLLGLTPGVRRDPPAPCPNCKNPRWKLFAGLTQVKRASLCDRTPVRSNRGTALTRVERTRRFGRHQLAGEFLCCSVCPLRSLLLRRCGRRALPPKTNSRKSNRSSQLTIGMS